MSCKRSSSQERRTLRRFLSNKKTPLVPQDQGLAPVPGECLKQLIALKTFIIIMLIIIIIIIIIIIPTRFYACQKTHTDMTGEVTCRLCNKAPESVAHVLAGCTALAQNKYITRHNAAPKILFFEILQDLGLAELVPPWYSPLKPKPVYEASNA